MARPRRSQEPVLFFVGGIFVSANLAFPLAAILRGNSDWGLSSRLR